MKSYNYDRDIQNVIFEKIFADTLNGDFEISQGYFPEWDVKCEGVTYEVKRDYVYNSSKNILIEEFFNLELNKKGWIYYTTADYYVVFISNNEYYIVNMYQLKNDFFNRLSQWYCKDITQEQGFTTRNWVTRLYNTKLNPIFYKIADIELEEFM